MMATDVVLELEHLVAGYGDLRILHGVSASFERGTVTTIIGGNGAGKSTLLRAVSGTCRLFAGSIRYEGRPLARLPPATRLALGIGCVPQGRCNFSTMSVAENLKMGCHTLPRRRHAAAIERVFALFPALRARSQVMAGSLSGGEQQMLETAMVMAVEPRLLLLDEPSLGLSPRMQDETFGMARRLADDGMTVIMVEQNTRGALRLSDRAIVLQLGRKVMEGTAAAVREDPGVQHALLGASLPSAA